MKPPKFAPSRAYVHGFKLNCLVGKMSHSQIPPVAKLCGKTKDVQVFLRSGKSAQLTPWLTGWVNKLFVSEEILKAIKAGMRDYESNDQWPGYDPEESGYNDIRTHGILPYLRLSSVVLDGVEKRILLELNTDQEPHLDEHGITIYWERGKWKFAYADYLGDYYKELEPDLPVGQKPKKFEKNIDCLYGTWVPDQEATEALLRARGDHSSIKSVLEEMKGLRYQISEGVCRYSYSGENIEAKIIDCEWRGTDAFVKLRPAGYEYDIYFGGKYRPGKLVCDDWVLRLETEVESAARRESGGVEFRETVTAPPAPVPPPAPVAPLKQPPVALGHSAQRWLKEAEGCGFRLLGWMQVAHPGAMSRTEVALSNADGSVVFVMYSKQLGQTFHAVGAEMYSQFPGPAEVTTSLFEIPASDPHRGNHRHTAKVSSIEALLQAHLVHMQRANLLPATAVRRGSLADYMASLEAEIHRKQHLPK